MIKRSMDIIILHILTNHIDLTCQSIIENCAECKNGVKAFSEFYIWSISGFVSVNGIISVTNAQVGVKSGIHSTFYHNQSGNKYCFFLIIYMQTILGHCQGLDYVLPSNAPCAQAMDTFNHVRRRLKTSCAC